ncbi:tRNA1(Val) (adenine(37)-N6)-methyltransferase [Clostridium aminobutyricum]|uniref:tRNA1(Val) (Adenine(37)-N6)-methyltransferase n=1 Tax=Clostridium aminobutyricum TaxID=33953 RepID=A0A939IH03_CLOAM|nr:tRNA1(Val) (adenine(37)-N6)-methyltransferase [Clostridium aminobutyricum]MBN7774265.1 tRNA1(Val) (adenine(37)-N6)-methyltransferase [Clostridium aminobutyricum]
MNEVDNQPLLLEGERVDEIGFEGLKLIQEPNEFCYGVDAVILADFAARGTNQKSKMKAAVDLGTGTGIIPFVLSHKTSLEKIYGIEIQKNSFDRACRNAQMNRLSHKVHFIHADIANPIEELESLRGTFDVVTSNPPYMTGKAGLINENEAKRIARHETTADLESFVAAAAGLLKPRGHFYMVHRPSRLVDICFYCRKHRLEPKELRFVAPDKNSAANIMLVHCVKYGNPELKILEQLSIYKEDHSSYSEEILKIYER